MKMFPFYSNKWFILSIVLAIAIGIYQYIDFASVEQAESIVKPITNTVGGSTYNVKTKTLSLAVIDIGSYVNGDKSRKLQISEMVSNELHKLGCLELTNHGISIELINNLYKESQTFFDQSEEYKKQYETTGILGSNGWEPFGKFNVGKTYNVSSKLDPVEYIILWYVQKLSKNSTLLNQYVPEKLGKLISQYTNKTRQITKVLNEIFSQALGLTDNIFEKLMIMENDTSQDNYFCEFRLWNYFSYENMKLKIKNSNEEINEETRFAAHGDWSLMTLNRIDNIAGLEIYLENMNEDIGWYSIQNDKNQMKKDNIIVNLGEATEMLTNGYWIAPLHRVTKKSKQRRNSIVYFVGPNMNAQIDILSNCQKCIQYGNQTRLKQFMPLPIFYKQHALFRFGGSTKHEDTFPQWL